MYFEFDDGLINANVGSAIKRFERDGKFYIGLLGMDFNPVSYEEFETKQDRDCRFRFIKKELSFK